MQEQIFVRQRDILCKTFHPSHWSLNGKVVCQPSLKQPITFLLQLGVKTLGGRRRIQRAAAELLREEPPAAQSEDPEDCWRQVPAGRCEGEQSEGPNASWGEAAQLPAGQCAEQQTEASHGGLEQGAHQRAGHFAEQQGIGTDCCWEHGLHQRTGQAAEPVSSPSMQPHSLPDTPGSPCDSDEQLTQLYGGKQPDWEGLPGACPDGMEPMAAEEAGEQEPQFEAFMWAAEHSVGKEAGVPSVDDVGWHLEASQQWQTMAAAPDAGCTDACAAGDWQLCSGTGHAEAATDGAIGDDEVVSLLTQEGHRGTAGDAIYVCFNMMLSKILRAMSPCLLSSCAWQCLAVDKLNIALGRSLLTSLEGSSAALVTRR